MKKTFLMLCLSAVGAAWAFTCQAADMTLAERHTQNGIRCEACHKVKMPQTGAVVNNEACFACHGSYEKLAQRTAKLNPNPHKTHLLNVRCSDCHSGHQASKLMCNDCHRFNLQPK